jgi:aryl-alcohol dehydrogenase-like predicted oxidoreductase
VDTTGAEKRTSVGILSYLRLATAAERTLAVDPSLTFVSLRQLSEAFARHAAARAGLLADHRDSSAHQLDLLRTLEQRGIVRDQIAEIFHMLRRVGNRAAHDFVGTHQDALNGLQLGFKLACWFHRTFGDAHARSAWKPPTYVPPADPTATLRALQEEAARARAEADAHKADAAKAKALLEAEAARRAEEASLRQAAEAERSEWEALAHAFEHDLKQAAAEQAKVVEAVAVDAASAPAEQAQQVVAQATAATQATDLDEHETRVLIDAQLRDAGWEVDTRTLRWSAGARPEKGKSRAIAEVPTWTKQDGAGIADYVLFVGITPYGVVEAKKTAKKIPSALEQSKRYARGLAASLAPAPPPSMASRAREEPATVGWATSLATAAASMTSRAFVADDAPDGVRIIDRFNWTDKGFLSGSRRARVVRAPCAPAPNEPHERSRRHRKLMSVTEDLRSMFDPSGSRAREPRGVTRRTFFQVGIAAAVIGRSGLAASEKPPSLLTRAIPSTGEKLPVIGLGTNRYGVTAAADLAARREVLRRLPELGGAVVDTAPAYGQSEAVIGRLVSELKNRDRLWLATKVTAPEGGAAEGRKMLDESFRRLRTERIELVQVHSLKGVPEMLPLLREQKQAGRLSYVGVTTSRDEQYDDLLEVMRREQLDFIQVDYSIADRNAANKILPLAAERGTAVLVNLPLGRGNVLAKVKDRPMPAWAAQIDATSFAQVFLKYVVSHPAVTVAIPGTTKLEHLVDNLGAARGRLPDAAMRRRIEKFFDAL